MTLATLGSRPPSQPELATLKSREFRRAREASWHELEQMLACRSGLKRRPLNAAELIRLPTLYRAALSSLSIARSIALDRSLEGYLENLCTRAFLLVYAPNSWHSRAVVPRLFVPPAVLRRLLPYLLLAAAVFLTGGICGYAMLIAEPGVANALQKITAIDLSASAAVNLFVYSLPMALLCVGLGLFAGVPTVILLLWHGLLLGAASAYVRFVPAAVPDPGSVLQVGVLVAGQLLCGAAGLRLGAALMFPGKHSRAVSITDASGEIAWLVGSAILLMFAGALLAGSIS